MPTRILSLSVEAEQDVVAARQRARRVAALCGFSAQEQTKIATAVSELARNIYNYAGRGKLGFSVEGSTRPQVLLLHFEDEGPGIENVDLILSGRYTSPTGMGLGLIGARRLVDQMEIDTAPGRGTRIIAKKLLPASAELLTPLRLGEFGAELARDPGESVLAELRQQNQELLATLAELRARQEELTQLTRELEDTNRGVVALYAELDEKASHLRRADEMKTRFLSNMSHEFRTPLSSIRALSKLLIERVDGPLSEEQEKQVRFILQGAESLTELVDDLLDLARIEAGKIKLRQVHFDLADMFSALRGMLRPLLVSERVRLVFEPIDATPMYTDEAKLSQILRNFISNALKFTEAGEVAVGATREPGGMIRISVRDTGIGIAPEHLDIIFEEFGQVEHNLQRKTKGTGLGLPLCRKLAEVIGGRVEVGSRPGEGSTFSVVIPTSLGGDESQAPVPATRAGEGEAGSGLPVLVVEDNPQMLLVYEKLIGDSGYRPVIAKSVWQAERAWAQAAPAAVLLDIHLQGEDSWRWLGEIKAEPNRRQVPVIIVSDINDVAKGMALGADAYFIKPIPRDDLLATLDRLTREPGVAAGAPLAENGAADSR